ncbi:MAG: hypothetical protein AAGE85_05865 [Pseudomonadota bacterium]
MTKRDHKLEENAKRLFDESVDRLDAGRLSQLNRARHRALDELDRAPVHAVWRRVLPASGVAAAAVLVTVLVLRTGEPVVEIPAVPAAAATDFEILVNEDSLEMLEELEFYSWLELTEASDSGQQT